jgi:hypothetical protein
MRCDAFLDRFDRLDAGAAVPLRLRRHLESCARCAALAEREAAAFRAAARDPAFSPRNADLLDERVMAAVRLSPSPRREMTLSRWLMPGALLVLAAALVPVGMDFNWLRAWFGFGWELPIALILGTLFAAYGAIFIGTHLEELEPFIRKAGGGH